MLLQKNMEPFCMLVSARTDDRQGGFRNEWTESEAFDACAVQRRDSDTSRGTEAAQKPEARRVYDVLTPRAAPLLPFHCIIRRKQDGRLFRIISDSADLQTPKGAKLDLRLYTADEWRLA